jgi:hypothetical protein
MPLITIVNLDASDVIITDSKKSFPPITVKASTTMSNHPVLGKDLESMGPVLARMVTAGLITYSTAQDPAIADDAENLMGAAAISDAAITAKKLAPELASVRSVRAETSVNLASFAGISTTFDGLTLVAGDRILVRKQTAPAENGIYVVGTVGGGTATWSRATDMLNASVLPNGLVVLVEAGTLGAGKVRKLSNTGVVTVGTTGLTFDKLVRSSEMRRISAVVGAEGAVAANAIEVALTITDEDGNTVGAAVEGMIFSTPNTANQGAISAAGTPVGTIGTKQNPATGDSMAEFTTTAGGLVSFRITNTVAEVNEVMVVVDGGLPRVLKLTFA